MKETKENYYFSLGLSNLILFVTFIYSILFYGGIIKIRPLIFYFNSIDSIAFTLLQLTLPPIFAFMLYLKYQNVKIDIKVSHRSIYVSFFLILLLIITQMKNTNLFADEISYAYKSFELNIKFLKRFVNFFPFFEQYSSSYALQIITLIQWIIIISIFYLFKKTTYNKKLILFVFFIFTLRFLVNIFVNVRGGPHPPLLYLSTNIFGAIFGLNSVSIKLSNCLPVFIFLIYLCNRIKFSFFEYFFVSLLLLTTPLIAYHALSFDQTIYSFICFSIIFLEIFFYRSKPENLFLFLSIMCLFRQTCIVAIPALLIYSFIFNWPYKSFKNMLKINLEKFFPMVLFFPVFINSLVLGTPTTGQIKNGIDTSGIFEKLLSQDLIFNSYNALGLYLMLPIILLFLLIIKNKFLEILIAITIFLTYITIQLIADTNAYDQKYYFELYGSFIAISLILYCHYLFDFLKNKKNIKAVVCIVSFIIFQFYSYSYSQQKYKLDTQKNFWERTKNFNPLRYFDNNLDYCIEYLKTNNIIKDSHMIGIDQGFFPLILMDCSLKEVFQFNKLNGLYNARKNKKLNWLVFDAKTLNETKEIKYLIFYDSILDIDINKKELKKLYGWEKIFSLPKTKNHLSITVLKRKEI